MIGGASNTDFDTLDKKNSLLVFSTERILAVINKENFQNFFK